MEAKRVIERASRTAQSTGKPLAKIAVDAEEDVREFEKAAKGACWWFCLSWEDIERDARR